MTFNWSGQSGQPTWLWGGNDSKNIYVYNPANFSVNYAASSNYSNSAGYANGAGYADSLRVNGSVVDPNSLGIYIATYNRYTYDYRNEL